ncbi:MAG: MaoC/PaaZ C-terminal domain-containing protein, partial [Alphaproteobacteria bacterium]|nr:MaoC/PaaZ C-terminal domain-containing protein [Alphaproteobacteria bacterium]
MSSTPDMWFEDFYEGRTFNFTGRKVEKDEIIEFASKYDPQPFHLDEEFAAKTPYGGLIASGWHTAAMVMRILCDNLFA